jgi:ABC-type multidrug transport system ATPase subunit
MQIDSVMKSFGTKQVLTDVFLRCTEGEIIGLLGRNGSGKSTLLKIIFGSLNADQKFVKIGGKINNGIYNNRNLVKYLPQHYFLPNHIKVNTIISLFCDNENGALIKKNEWIKPMLGKKSHQLSGGEKRLLEILLIIYSNARYVMIDEPFNGIAPIYKEEIKNRIKEQSKYKGFIITDHDYWNILDLSTKIILMHDGGTKEIKDVRDLEFWGYIPEGILSASDNYND